MNAIKYFHNRFSYAIKTNGTIKVNQQDIEAVNKLVEFEKKRNTDLEDALLLYFIFWQYSIENENNKLKIANKTAKYPLGINNPLRVLENLSKRLDCKDYIIKKIVDELWIYQEYERVYQDQELYKQEIKNDVWEKHGIYSILKITPQQKIPIPKDEKIRYEEVKEILEKALITAKEDFEKIKTLM